MERNEQIKGLLQSINQLTQVYKQLNDLVIEQGSLIDRIDYNIEETFTHVEQGNVHLVNAEKQQDSSCSMKCILVLILLIVILGIVFGIKHSVI